MALTLSQRTDLRIMIVFNQQTRTKKNSETKTDIRRIADDDK